MTTAKRRRKATKRSGGINTGNGIRASARTEESERVVIYILEAAPNGVPTHLVCSQCSTHWPPKEETFGTDGLPYEGLAYQRFVRNHLNWSFSRHQLYPGGPPSAVPGPPDG